MCENVGCLSPISSICFSKAGFQCNISFLICSSKNILGTRIKYFLLGFKEDAMITVLPVPVGKFMILFCLFFSIILTASF